MPTTGAGARNREYNSAHEVRVVPVSRYSCKLISIFSTRTGGAGYSALRFTLNSVATNWYRVFSSHASNSHSLLSSTRIQSGNIPECASALGATPVSLAPALAGLVPCCGVLLPAFGPPAFSLPLCFGSMIQGAPSNPHFARIPVAFRNAAQSHRRLRPDTACGRPDRKTYP